MELVAALEYKCPTVKPRQWFLQGWGSKRARKPKTKKSCRAKDGLPTMSSGMSSVWMLDTVVNSGNNLHCTGARLGSAFQTGNDLKCAYGTLYSFTNESQTSHSMCTFALTANVQTWQLSATETKKAEVTWYGFFARWWKKIDMEKWAKVKQRQIGAAK